MNQPFVPNVLRFKKSRRREKGGKETRRTQPVLYEYGLCSIENGKIFSKHLEMLRKTINNFYKRNTKVLIRIIPTISYTKKPNDVRRGRGKGSVESWYSWVRENRVLCEFQSPDLLLATKLSSILRSKLPIKTKLLVNQNYSAEKANIMTKKSRAKS